MKFLILALLTLGTTSAHAGWEVGGGDGYALKFVKTARLAADELESKTACPLREKIPIFDLRRAIERDEVVGTQSDQIAQKDKIEINRRSWPGLPRNKKIEWVLKAYTKDSSHPFVDQVSQDDLKKCFNSSLWDKIADGRGTEEGDRNLSVEQDFDHTVDKLGVWLKANPKAQVQKSFAFCDLAQAFEKTAKVHTSNLSANCAPGTSNPIALSTTPLALPLGPFELKDGINRKSAALSEITLNRSRWRSMNRGQRMELVMHEYLNIIHVDDHMYQVSSRLFYDLPSEYYRE